MRAASLAALLALLPGYAAARNVEPGEMWLNGGAGLSLKLGGALGGSSAHFALAAGGEYTFSKSLGAAAHLNVGLAGTIPLRLRAGVRYRLADLGLPVSPYGQAQLSVGRLYDVIGANLTTAGIFLGAGADYFLTAQLGLGALLGVDLSRTFVDEPGRPVFFGTFEFLATVSYRL